MNKTQDALKLALEALEDYVEEYGPHEQDSGAAYAITAIREALAEQPYPDNFIDALKYDVAKRDSEALVEQPAQEPVAWATRMGEYAHIHWGAKRPEYPMVYEVPLYTSPPNVPTARASKPWVGLTDEERDEIYNTHEPYADLKAVEAKLKEKNNG